MEAAVSAVVFLPFLTLPILAAFFLDTDLFVLFLVMFCVVGGLCTACPTTRSRGSRGRSAQRRPRPHSESEHDPVRSASNAVDDDECR